MFEKPGVIGPDSKFFAGPQAVLRASGRLRPVLDRGASASSYEFTKTQSVSAELAVEYSDIEDFFHPDGQRHLIVSIPLQYVFDNRDNKLDPKHGLPGAGLCGAGL